MKKSFIVFISVLLIVLQTASAFAYSDLNVGSSGLKMSSSNSGRYQNVTVKNKGVLNLNGWGLEVYGDMKVEKGSKVKNGVIIFRNKKGSLKGLPLYENVQGHYGEIKGGLAAIWKNWEISDLSPMLVYDEAVAGYCFPVTTKGGSLYGADCDTIPSKDSPNYETYQEEVIGALKAKKISKSTIEGIKSTKITVKAVKNCAESKDVIIPLKWSKSAGYAVDGYKLYRATSKDGKYKMIAEFDGDDIRAYRDMNVKSGKTYYYKVRGYRYGNGTTYYTPYSSVISAVGKKA